MSHHYLQDQNHHHRHGKNHATIVVRWRRADIFNYSFTDVDLGKLTGRVKALFMAVPKEMKHMMKTTTTNHADGVKRWAIEVKFPFGTLEKANKQFYDDDENVKTGARMALAPDYSRR